MIFRVALLALFVPLMMSTATAAVVASHASPGAVLNVNISLDNDGRVMDSVTRKGQPVIEPSQLGFLLTDAPKLDFLDADRKYDAHIYRDGDNADWRTKPHSIVTERRVVQRGDSLTIRLGAGGGQAIRFAARGGERKPNLDRLSLAN